MLRQVITGGQTGVDQAAWRAAEALGLETGGAMPLGFLTEDGPRPEFAGRFGAEPLDSPLVDDRTRANAEGADATIVFVEARSGPGTVLTVECARATGKPLLILSPDECADPTLADRIASWIAEHRVSVLNVAGDRESISPGIGDRVGPVLARAFAIARDPLG
jgi:hypothetical protein